MKIDLTTIEAIRAALDELPPAPTTRVDQTKVAAVAELAPQLLELRRKGYGLVALAALLTDKGLPITPGTLKNYLQRSGATRTRRRRAAVAPRNDNAPAPDSAMSPPPPRATAVLAPPTPSPAPPATTAPASAPRVLPPGFRQSFDDI